jgi:uncharacterized protein (UPF0276 family)
MKTDRVGLGWRRELAPGIFANLDRIDVLEVIADDFFNASQRERRALRTLAAQTPVVLHGVTLGLASAVPVETKLLEKSARLFEEVRPDYWSEHLAFVRGGGIEIEHLTAAPRTPATIEGAAENLAKTTKIVGVAPLVENIATLIEPPGSVYDEATWIAEILHSTECDMLLDLHNLYANSLNFNYDPLKFLAQMPLERIKAIHLAGGKWVSAQGNRRLLDDHFHDVPEPVYQLLTEVGARTPHPLTVILERDGNYPSMDCLLTELDLARQALSEGRNRRVLRADEVAA